VYMEVRTVRGEARLSEANGITVFQWFRGRGQLAISHLLA
jgi:hypothetical protein